MSEVIYIDGVDRVGITKTQDGYSKTVYQLSHEWGFWEKGKVKEFKRFDELLIDLMQSELKQTDGTPLDCFNAINNITKQLNDERIRLQEF